MIDVLYYILDSATISFFSPKNKLILEEGDTLQIVCEADGYPFPNITWSKNNNIFSRKDVHYFKALSCGDSGYYTCTVTNGIGSTDEDGFNLSIPCKYYMSPNVLYLVRFNSKTFILQRQLNNI